MDKILTLISDLLDDFENNRILLSSFINRALRIAYLLHDWDYVIYLTMNQTDIECIDITGHLSAEVIPIIVKEIGKEQYSKLSLRMFNKYFKLRLMESISKGKDGEKSYGHSVSCIESNLEMLSRQMEKNVVPDGLTPIDLYFQNQSKMKIDMTIELQIHELKAIANRIGNDLYQHLVYKSHDLPISITTKSSALLSKKIFIIHGHDEAKLRELKDLIKNELELTPIILSEQPDKGLTLIEKFEYYAKECSYAFAIFTPDDIVENNGVKYFQARANVIFEVGWFYANLGRSRVCLILKESPEMGVFSDLQGVLQKRFYKNISEIFREISMELKEIGII